MSTQLPLHRLDNLVVEKFPKRAGRKAPYVPPLLAKRMEERKLTIGQLAKKVGISAQGLGLNLRGDKLMSLRTALSILTELGYAMDDCEALVLLKEINSQSAAIDD